MPLTTSSRWPYTSPRELWAPDPYDPADDVEQMTPEGDDDDYYLLLNTYFTYKHL